jgi:hypothetical protein
MIFPPKLELKVEIHRHVTVELGLGWGGLATGHADLFSTRFAGGS